MSYNPNTGLVYIPGHFGGWPYVADPNYKGPNYNYEEGKWGKGHSK
jgi:hypothetical protein